MQRRNFCLGLASSLALGLALPAQANSLSERVERRLKRDGWDDIDITRTLLGRTRVTARKGETRREIIMNSRTGEVLRDVLIHDRDGIGSVFDDDDDDDDDNGGKGRGRGRGGDDGSDDNDDGDSDDGDSDDGGGDGDND